MHRASVRVLFVILLAASIVFGFGRSADACEVPAPVGTIDPPGYYDDATGYARAVKPMRDFVARLNTSAAKGDWSCALDLLESWAKADALMGHTSVITANAPWQSNGAGNRAQRSLVPQGVNGWYGFLS